MKKGYIKFLKSKKWKRIKDIYYSEDNQDNRHCFICGSVKDLNIHHISYKGDLIEKTNGLIDPVNLVILCRNCHIQAHRDLVGFKNRWNKVVHPKSGKTSRYLQKEEGIRWVRIGDVFVKAAY